MYLLLVSSSSNTKYPILVLIGNFFIKFDVKCCYLSLVEFLQTLVPWKKMFIFDKLKVDIPILDNLFKNVGKFFKTGSLT